MMSGSLMFARAKKNRLRRHPANAGYQFIAPFWTWGFWTTCSRAHNQVEFSLKSRRVPMAIIQFIFLNGGDALLDTLVSNHPGQRSIVSDTTFLMLFAQPKRPSTSI